MPTPHLFCIHRNQLVRHCLAQALPAALHSYLEQAFESSAVAPADAEQRLQQADEGLQIALVDLQLADEAAAALTRFCLERNIRVVLLCPSIEPETAPYRQLVKCITLGAHGYVLEDAAIEELVAAIDNVRTGQLYCSSIIFAQLMDQLVKLSGGPTRFASTEPRKLTERELQILHWIAEGYSNKQVAKQLALSIYTVKNHVHRILNKLNASDRTHAVRHALDANWLPLSESVAHARFE